MSKQRYRNYAYAINRAILTSADSYELFTGPRSTRNLYLYQKRGYREFKRIPVNNSLNIIFLKKYVI